MLGYKTHIQESIDKEAFVLMNISSGFVRVNAKVLLLLLGIVCKQ